MTHDDLHEELASMRREIIKGLTRLRGDTALAEDAFHDACISALKRGPRSFESREKLRNFIGASAHGDLITQRGRAARKAFAYHETLSTTAASPSPEPGYIARLDIATALRGVPIHKQAIMVEILEDRISCTDGAAELHMKVSTLAKQMAHLRARLAG